VIGVLNYGLGNVNAFLSLFRRAGVEAGLVSTVNDFSSVSGLILPGVGAFDDAMSRFEESGLREATEVSVFGVQQLPIIGVCVGMQMMVSGSDEGVRRGLGWVPGYVRRLPMSVRLPHLGWNDVDPVVGTELFEGIVSPRFYFLHSYYLDATNEEDVIATTDYGGVFSCAVKNGNVFGVQFHPEKSHDYGSRLLLNFAHLCSC
jgi:glutamine amidotransferase